MNNDLLSDEEIIHAARQCPAVDCRRSQRRDRKSPPGDRRCDTRCGAFALAAIRARRGCGEGWLARACRRKSIQVIGVDGVPELIERAQAAGGADFRVVSYEEIAMGKLDVTAGAVICNFSLIGKASVDGIFLPPPDRCYGQAAPSSSRPCTH